MTRLHRPFTPEQDIAAYPLGAATEGHGLTPDVIALCQAGVSIIFAVRRPDGAPIAGLGLACRVTADERVRVLVLRRANADALQALMRDSRIAVTFTRVPDHRSIQLKGSGAVIGATTPEDLRSASRQARAFRDALIDLEMGDNYSIAYCSYDATDLVAIEFTPDHAFTQTPGPGAGTQLAIAQTDTALEGPAGYAHDSRHA